MRACVAVCVYQPEQVPPSSPTELLGPCRNYKRWLDGDQARQKLFELAE
jgi:hypothetical protein